MSWERSARVIKVLPFHASRPLLTANPLDSWMNLEHCNEYDGAEHYGLLTGRWWRKEGEKEGKDRERRRYYTPVHTIPVAITIISIPLTFSNSWQHYSCREDQPANRTAQDIFLTTSDYKATLIFSALVSQTVPSRPLTLAGSSCCSHDPHCQVTMGSMGSRDPFWLIRVRRSGVLETGVKGQQWRQVFLVVWWGRRK